MQCHKRDNGQFLHEKKVNIGSIEEKGWIKRISKIKQLIKIAIEQDYVKVRAYLFGS